ALAGRPFSGRFERAHGVVIVILRLEGPRDPVPCRKDEVEHRSGQADQRLDAFSGPRLRRCQLGHERDSTCRYAVSRSGSAHRPWCSLSAMQIREIMTASVVTAAPDAPAREVAALMRDLNVGSVVLLEEAGRPCGIVTD